MSQQHPYHHDGLSSHADSAAWQSGQMAVDHGPSSRPNLVPIPAPQPKTSYNAPVFQTFQDRRRARDMARQAASSKLLPTPHPSTVHIPHPDPSTLAMKERPSDSPPSRFPTLPSSYAPGQTPTPQAGPSRPLPRPLPSSVIITLPVGLSPTQLALSSLARSDTVSSVKSLDRYGFSSARRPLPRTPVGVNSSKSLDRGIPSGDETVKRELRKQPSVVAEEEEQGFAPVPPLDIVVPTIVSPPETVPLQIPSITVEPGPTIAVNDIRTPAKFSPLPSFNLPDSDSDDSDAGNTSGVEIAALPAIAVSSGHSLPGGMLSNVAIICAGCGQPIIGRIVNAMGRRFHPACFKCNECGSLLEHVSSFEYDGKAYCHLDYHDVSAMDVRASRGFPLTPRNSPTTAFTARPPSSRTASSRSTTTCSASDITTSCTSSAPNAATLFSTRPSRRRLGPNALSRTMLARPTRLSYTRVILTASDAISGFTSRSAKRVESQYQKSRSMRWGPNGTKSASSAR